jgi:hypothetical protein
MTQHTQPTLARRGDRKYQCDDIAPLHRWLEEQGYRFYGQHSPGEYGRFSRQEADDHGGRRSYLHSFIQVFENGEVYSPDPFACELLDTLARDEGLERTA